MIFPGMDPYLEDPAMWPGFHNALIVYIRDHLRPQLRPAVVTQAYDSGSYEDLLDYQLPCSPPLGASDQSWANEVIAAWRQKTDHDN
ncbi:MAG TPA: DUF4058 family protein [Pirellulales bacterium]|nr:DUF4058 family protein [Pirellulales bacterium]